ncbi:helix-turn-helix transcriptional regulator [Micromonospora sp. NBC_00421]|uniref:helix-turn-helix transcriptional regulator n=1 Tax=Micromonospora sp. NBC_00421 TaxID=2975976 RepID=UPI002E1B8D18
MRAPDDLHPDDHAHRLGLRDLIVDARRVEGISQARLAARAGIAQSAIASFETRDTQHLNKYRLIAHHLGLRVLAYPDGLPGGPYDDPDLLLFRPASDFAAANAWDQKQLVASLGSARRAAGLTQAQMAARLGSTENAVGEFERTRHGLMVATVQRYCRVLGGFLWLGVETVPQFEAVAA